MSLPQSSNTTPPEYTCAVRTLEPQTFVPYGRRLLSFLSLREFNMGLVRTYLAAKAKSIRNEQHWQNEVQLIVRPRQIKLRAG